MDFVKIQGYKSFKKIAVCLHPINLLIGANGAGKSISCHYSKCWAISMKRGWLYM